MENLTMILSILASVLSSMILFFLQKYFRKKEKDDNIRYKTKAKENYLIIKSVNAIGKLTMVNSKALRDGKTNGELKFALEDYEKIYREMYNYLLEQNSNK